ncbi:hypothetical protein QOZ80_3AG0224670 [Eleusine coracana subsp. coracana]|nr:hypothetical protein QOZ80_3AG0224670 [Eleusine coracana subsp. coracana]
MNQFVPDWNNMGDNSRPLGEDDDLIELLWCNGHVVMQSQSHRKLPPRPDKPAAPGPPAPAPAAPTPTTAPEDEAGLWFPFTLADSLDKDIFSDFFCEPPPPPAPVAPVTGKPPCTEAVAPRAEGGGGATCTVSEAPPSDLMPPPKSTTPHVSCSRQQTISLGADGADDLSELVRAAGSGGRRKAAAGSGASSSMLSAIGSSICGSNQVVAPPRHHAAGAAPGDTAGCALPSAVGSANANASGRGHEASSSGRSNGCFGATCTTEPTSTSNRSSKRKRLDTTEDEEESPSEDAESESAAAARKLTTARRSRAAEVHNLSERRRRDRINEKMRALQELIPHCNKTDKASMLDEAIEYLKSLQLQVQMMWMGSGIAAPPVMFPGVHQYLPRMGVGMGSMPRMPFMAPQPVVPSPPVNPVPLSPGYRGHMPAMGITEPYAHYLGVNHLQPTPTQHFAQGVGYYPLGAKAVQQNPAAALHMPSASMAAAAPGVLPPESAPNTGPG